MSGHFYTLPLKILSTAMSELFTLQNLFTFLMLILLQAVLGFDNLLYISLESKRVAKDKQGYVRTVGISIAIVLRVVLLVVLVNVLKLLEDPFINVDWKGVLEMHMSVHAVIVIGGGAFIIYTAVKEIWHMISVNVVDESDHAGDKTRPIKTAVFWIVIMNLVFSFDSILSAMALSDNVYIMGSAVVVSGILMIWLSGHVARFLQKNRLYEVLGLFILLIVGIMLLSEGGHKAELSFFDHEVHAMSKGTFYFVIAVLVIVDLVQGRYQKKLDNGHE